MACEIEFLKAEIAKLQKSLADVKADTAADVDKKLADVEAKLAAKADSIAVDTKLADVGAKLDEKADTTAVDAKLDRSEHSRSMTRIAVKMVKMFEPGRQHAEFETAGTLHLSSFFPPTSEQKERRLLMQNSDFFESVLEFLLRFR
jgi:hypothetical protein